MKSLCQIELCPLKCQITTADFPMIWEQWEHTIMIQQYHRHEPAPQCLSLTNNSWHITHSRNMHRRENKFYEKCLIAIIQSRVGHVSSKIWDQGPSFCKLNCQKLLHMAYLHHWEKEVFVLRKPRCKIIRYAKTKIRQVKWHKKWHFFCQLYIILLQLRLIKTHISITALVCDLSLPMVHNNDIVSHILLPCW